jgi:hypothetical protein
LEEVAGEEVVSEEAVVETPSEETFEGVLWNEGFGNETKGDAVYLESEEASKMASDKGKAYNVKLNKPYIVSKDGDFDIIKGFIEEFKSNNPKSKWHPDTTKFVNDKLRELGYDGLVIKQEAIDTDKGYADIESTYGNAQVVAFDKKSVTPIEQPQAKEEIVETPPSEVVSEEVITPKEEVGEVEVKDIKAKKYRDKKEVADDFKSLTGDNIEIAKTK